MPSKYIKARRSLRIWPIEGQDEREMTASLKRFLEDALEIEDTHSLGIESIVRARNSPTGIVYNEVIIKFDSTENRDFVSTLGSKLADLVDENGRPENGLRIQIPEHLRQIFRSLDNYGHLLKCRYGEDLRKYIKFDDTHRPLFLSTSTPP